MIRETSDLGLPEAADVRNGQPSTCSQDTTVKYYLARDPNADSLKYTPWDQNQNALYAMAALDDATQTDIRPFIIIGGFATFSPCSVRRPSRSVWLPIAIA